MTSARPDFLETPELSVSEAMQAATVPAAREQNAVSGVLYDEKAERRAGRFRLLAMGCATITAIALLTAVISPSTPGIPTEVSVASGITAVVFFILTILCGRAARTEWFRHDLDGHEGFFRDLQDADDEVDAVWETFRSGQQVYSVEQVLADRARIVETVRSHISGPTEERLVAAINELPLPPVTPVPASPILPRTSARG